MDVKFDLVRLGEKRKNSLSETLIKQNVDILRKSIRNLLKDKTSNSKYNSISMTMVIPAKGHNIKIHFQNIPEKWIRKELKDNYPNSIYKGKYDILLDNLNNRIF